MPNFDGIDSFFRRYNLDHCQAAKLRFKEGKSSYKGEDTDSVMSVRVMEVTKTFIFAIDQQELGQYEINDVLPSLIEVQNALYHIPDMS